MKPAVIRVFSMSFARNHQRAFTLIELMIVVAIIAILTAIALPGYNDYIIRGRLTNGTNAMSTLSANMEQHRVDNRQYTTAGAFTSPCAAPPAVPNFTIACSGVTDTPGAYLITVTGTGSLAGFVFTLNQNNVRTTTGAITNWSPAALPVNCWVLSRGQSC